MAYTKTRFYQKLSYLELLSLLTTYEVVHGLFKEPIIGPVKFKTAETRHLENRHDIFLPWMRTKFGTLVENDMPTAVIWWKSKPEVKFQIKHFMLFPVLVYSKYEI